MQLVSDKEVQKVFDQYPKDVKRQMKSLRKLIIQCAEELDEVDELQETLKWGEPSYLTKYGSTVRVDWKEKQLDIYSIFFKCTSKLVETFQGVFGEQFTYEKTRAIQFKLGEQIPEVELKQCIKAAMMYHKVKTKPLLGIVC